MDLKAELHNTSRLLADMVADAIVEKPALLPEAIDLSETGSYPYPMRVSRVIWLVFERAPELMYEHLNRIFAITFSTEDSSVRRNFLGLVLHNYKQWNEEQLGNMLDMCLKWVNSPLQPAAVKGISMKILEQIGKQFPELIPEIVGTIENQMDEATTGVKAVSRNTIKALRKHL